MFENIGHPGMGWNPAGATSECMQLESSSRNGCDLASCGHDRGAAVEADTIGEQLKWTLSGSSGRSRGAAALHRELFGAGLLTVGERWGSS